MSTAPATVAAAPAATEDSSLKRKADSMSECAAAAASSSAAAPSAAAASSSTSAPAAAAAGGKTCPSGTNAGTNNWTEEERAAKRAKREERKAAIQQLDEAVDPLYPGFPECRVMIYNVAKKQNVGTIVRTAVAFAATQIIVVGNRKLNTLGNQATNRFISWRHFDKFPDAVKWAKAAGFKLVGVEIGDRAVNISTRPFSDKTIFILGNEGAGMSQETMDACDELVYIPQYGMGTASLNVATATSIVLHHFAEWAKYPQHCPVDGAKFRVDVSKARADQGHKLALEEGAAAAASSTMDGGEGAGGDDGGD